MRLAAAIPYPVIYIIDSKKRETAILFYGATLALVIHLVALLPTGQSAHFGPIPLPYTEIQPHGPALKPLTTTASLVSSLGPTPAATVIAVPAGGQTWPMHGRITTEFGAPDYPYQSHHTGIDITSARPAGYTSVAAFRAGTVAAVVHQSTSYGNHVIIDHGNGLTSLYGHLYSTRVSVGQHVEAGAALGTEGSTGASTGPHVHFEIRQNNQPVNPRTFLPGNP